VFDDGHICDFMHEVGVRLYSVRKRQILFPNIGLSLQVR
jgi:hypothetical protein